MERLKHHAHTALRHSEKYFKTDTIYLTRGGFWLTLGQGLSSISSLVLVLAFAHLAPKDVYGHYTYILSLVSILAIISLNGLPMAVTQSVSRGFEGALRQGFLMNLRFGWIFALTAVLTVVYYAYNNNFIISQGILIAAIFSPIIASTVLYNAFLNGKKEFRANALYGVYRTWIPTLAAVVTLFFTQNLTIILGFVFLSQACVNLALYKMTLKNYRPDESKEDPELFEHAKKLTLMGVIGIIASQIDKVLVFHYLGAQNLAIYTVATVIPDQIRNLLRNAGVLALPKFAAQSIEAINKSLFHKTLLFSTVVAGSVIGYILLAPFFYKYVMPQYLDALHYSQIFALALLASVSIIPSSILQAKRENKSLTTLTTVDALSLCLFSLILIPFYGIWGAIIAKIANRYLVAIVNFNLVKKLNAE